jgi:UPF0716 protein FxsA
MQLFLHPKIEVTIFMRLFLFLLFPFLEIFIFIQVGDELGFGWAFLGLIIAFLLGLNLFRFVGTTTARNIMQSLASAGPNAPKEMGSVMAKLAAAVLLMIPGFLTDFIALLLLLPLTRSLLMLFLIRRMMKAGSFQFQMKGFQTPPNQDPFRRHSQDDVIEGEATEVKSDTPRVGKDK